MTTTNDLAVGIVRSVSVETLRSFRNMRDHCEELAHAQGRVALSYQNMADLRPDERRPLEEMAGAHKSLASATRAEHAALDRIVLELETWPVEGEVSSE